MGILADELVNRIAETRRWPMASEADVWAELVEWIAFRENDRELLRRRANWTSATDTYRVDPLPERISGAFATLLFGSEPLVKAVDKGDQERLEELLRLNRWSSRLRTAEEKCSSEGEVFYRIVSDNIRFDAPTITWHSRLDVIPHYVNQQLRAVAFVNELVDNLDDDPSTEQSVVYRHFEIHDPVSVRNVLFRGDQTTIGIEVDLDEHDETRNLIAEWDHEEADVGMLAGRIINIEGQDPTLGKSDFDGLEDWFLELNEILATGSKNRDLTALKRIYAPRSALDENDNLPADKQVLATDDSDTTWEGGAKDQFGTLELSFDADALVKWQNQVAITALSRRGITAQFVGLPTDAGEGSASTGVALRVRLIPSKAEGDRRAGPWRDELDGILLKLQKLDALGRDSRGFGTTWAKADEPPSVQLGDPLPVDGVEEASRLSTLRTAQLISIKQGVIDQHPDWSDERVDEEVTAIHEDKQADQAALPFGRAPGAAGAPAAAGAPPDAANLDGGTFTGSGDAEVTVNADGDSLEVAGLAGP